MSEVFIAWQPAPADTVFAQGAFDAQIGGTIRVRLPGGGETEGTIRGVEVEADGSGAKFMVEVPDRTLPKMPLAGYSIGRS